MSAPSEQVEPTSACLLNELQQQIPLVERPFAEVGQRAGLREEETLSRITALSTKPGGIIRQISAIFDSASLGYQSCLVAVRVDESRINEAAAVINQHPGVSHNYRRNHEFNLWFTIALPPDSALGLEKTVEILKHLSGAESMHLLPSITVYKIGVKFDLSGDGEVAARVDHQPRGSDHRKEKFVATESDKMMIRALQKNLPLVAKPFEALAREAGVDQGELLAAAQSYLDRGIMRRFAAVIRHRQAGFGANAMGVWIVPEGEEDNFGATAASFEAVSHCYRRPTYEGWPYSVFTMVHGKTAGDCETVLAEIAKATKVDQYLSLYSTHEYKKTRVQYFTPANAAWEAQHLEPSLGWRPAMIDVSVLYSGLETPSTPHRYGRKITQIDPPEHQRMAVAKSAKERRPIVVWNLTRTCNLKCVHCYTASEAKKYPDEISTEKAKEVLDDLAEFKVPAVLFSGGEPLVRPDLFELAAHARLRGLHVVLSTNGTLITRKVAQDLKDLNFAYVGISLDSAIPSIHDEFRGMKGAFERTMEGFRNCVAVDQKVGLRLTLTRHTAENLDKLFDLIEREGINRACFYHLCPAGRGRDIFAPTNEQARRAIDTIITRTDDLVRRGKRVEILTVDNHCDGPYMYLRMLRENHPRAGQVMDMLRWNGGGTNSSGVGIADIDFVGNVHADQFSMFRTFGNVKERKFSEIWQDVSNPIMAGLKNRLPLLKGRCGVCKFKDACGGGLRARAEISTGDPWAADPGCYLTDEEIGLTAPINDEKSSAPVESRATQPVTCCAEGAIASAV